MAVRCPQCGAETADDPTPAQCPQCGTALAPASGDPAPAPPGTWRCGRCGRLHQTQLYPVGYCPNPYVSAADVAPKRSRFVPKRVNNGPTRLVFAGWGVGVLVSVVALAVPFASNPFNWMGSPNLLLFIGAVPVWTALAWGLIWVLSTRKTS